MINLDISFSDGMYALLLPCIIVEINKIKAVPDAMARVTKSGAKIAVCHHSLAPCVAKIQAVITCILIAKIKEKVQLFWQNFQISPNIFALLYLEA